MVGLRAKLRRQAVTIVALYAGTSSIWITVSDPLLGALVLDRELLLRISAFKGLAFVAATAGLLYLLLRRTFNAIERAIATIERKEAERLLQEEERRRAEAIVASTSDAVISKTLDGVITSWNPAAEAMFGYGAAEIIGRSIELLVPPERPDEEVMILRRIKAGEHIEQLETHRMRQDGSTFEVAITFSPIWGPDEARPTAKTIVGVSKIVRDISARKRAEAIAEKEQGFARSLIEAMPGILYLYDKEGHLLRWNQNFERVSGYSGKEIAGMHPLDLFARGERDRVEERIANVFATGQSNVEASFLAKDGSSTPHFFTGKRIVFDGETCLLGVGVDISERILAEEALRELNESLELKVAERTRDLETARERAEAADQLKSAFLATMSHELRTPLNSIIGFTGIILQGLTGPLNEEQTKQLGMVQTSARHLLALINDVLDISKIEAGQLDVRFTPFDLRASLERVTSSLAPLLTKKGLTLRVVAPEGEHLMTSDQRRVEQVLLNLLNNAIKFTERGGVTLTMEMESPSGADGVGPMVSLRVADTGIGMKEQDLSRLFQPFHQIDSGLQRRHDGTGLGLAICRRLTGLLGGTVGAESTWGQGSVFTVLLPLTRP